MDSNSPAFHSSEPCHLTLCKLMDGIGKKSTHLVVAENTKHVLGYELIFKTVIHKVFGLDTFSQEPFYLLDKAFFKPCIQTGVDSSDPLFPANERTYIKNFLRKIIRAWRRVRSLVFSHFNRPYDAASGL